MTPDLAKWSTAAAPTKPCRPDTFVDVDPIAVERACRGERSLNLNRAEMALAFSYLDSHGHSARHISEVLGVSQRTVCRWRSKRHFPCSRLASGRRAELRGVAA